LIRLGGMVVLCLMFFRIWPHRLFIDCIAESIFKLFVLGLIRIIWALGRLGHLMILLRLVNLAVVLLFLMFYMGLITLFFSHRSFQVVFIQPDLVWRNQNFWGQLFIVDCQFWLFMTSFFCSSLLRLVFNFNKLDFQVSFILIRFFASEKFLVIRVSLKFKGFFKYL
jgi:hypothetical protein